MRDPFPTLSRRLLVRAFVRALVLAAMAACAALPVHASGGALVVSVMPSGLSGTERAMPGVSARVAPGAGRAVPVASAPVALTSDARAVAVDTLVHVVLDTELGEIELALDSAAAPVTTDNFLRYVDAGLYAGGTFYRTVRADNQPDDSIRIAVVQGGVDRSRRGEGFDPIPMEGTGTTGLRHLDGTISMARGGPDSARGEFFICVGDQPELDEGGRRNADGRGFAAFGQVVRGMEVVHAIHRRAAEGQYLTEPVRIEEARRGG